MTSSRSMVTKKRGVRPFLGFIFPGITLLTIILIFPVSFALVLSFTDRQLIYLGSTNFVGLSNYVEMVRDKGFWSSLLLQLGFITIAIPIELVIGFFVALLFNNEFPLCKLLRSLLMLPVFILPVLSGLTWRLMLQPRYGILATFFSSISLGPSAWLADRKYAYLAILLQDIWRMWPFIFMIIYAGLSSMSKEYLEAAQIDGARFWQKLYYVIIPCLKPVIAMAFLLRLIDALRIFSEVYVMTYGGPSNATMLLSLYIHKQAFEFGKISYASSIAIFLLIISLGLSYFVVKKGLRSDIV